jgi:hypothetical protein
MSTQNIALYNVWGLVDLGNIDDVNIAYVMSPPPPKN